MHVTNLAIFIGYQTYELLMSFRNGIQEVTVLLVNNFCTYCSNFERNPS